MEATPEGCEPTLVLASPFKLALDLRSIHFDLVLQWTKPMSLHRVEMAAIAAGPEFDRSHSGTRGRPRAAEAKNWACSMANSAS